MKRGADDNMKALKKIIHRSYNVISLCPDARYGGVLV